jgi:hypothetical protein
MMFAFACGAYRDLNSSFHRPHRKVAIRESIFPDVRSIIPCFGRANHLLNPLGANKDWQAITISDRHDLCYFAAFCFSDFAPFCGGEADVDKCFAEINRTSGTTNERLGASAAAAAGRSGTGCRRWIRRRCRTSQCLEQSRGRFRGLRQNEWAPAADPRSDRG